MCRFTAQTDVLEDVEAVNVGARAVTARTRVNEFSKKGCQEKKLRLDLWRPESTPVQASAPELALEPRALDCGPMSGFDNAKVDEEFFGAGVERDGMCEEYIPGTVKSNFLCSIGYGDPASVRPRAPRLEFAEVCHVL